MVLAVVSGGFDSRIVLWDYNKGRRLQRINMNGAYFWCLVCLCRGSRDLYAHAYVVFSEESSSSSNQMINPPFVYSIALSNQYVTTGWLNGSSGLYTVCMTLLINLSADTLLWHGGMVKSLSSI